MYRLGLDLGGTNIVAGVVDEKYNIVSTAARKTLLPRSAELIADDMAAACIEAVKKADINLNEIDYIGIGSPGVVDPEKGTVLYANNLNFHNIPICKMLKSRTGVECFLENDANAAAYGEYIAGIGAGTDNFIMLTYGTGVGGGIIINGKIYSGKNNCGGELGHMVINMHGKPCTCGRNGCYEAYASATALIKQTKSSMQNNKNSKMWDVCNGDINKVSGITAFKAADQGDTAAKAVINDYLYYVSVGIANLVNIFQPDIVALGGGISNAGDKFTGPVAKMVASEVYTKSISIECPAIKQATLGNNAGIIGAAFLKEQFNM